MAEYIYTRSLVNGKYSIDYGHDAQENEETPLLDEIVSAIPGKTSYKTQCDGSELKILIDPELSSSEKTVLDNTVSGHS